VDFLLNRVGPGADLVVGAGNDARRTTVGGFDAYYVHRAGTNCSADFEGTISTAAINPTVVADPARDAFFFADDFLAAADVEVARSTAATLLNTTACPNGTQLNGNNPNCWPVQGLAAFANPKQFQLTLIGSYLAVDPRTSGTGAGDVYVVGSIENTQKFPATRNVQIIACANANLSCGSPLVVTGTDSFGSAPFVQVRQDGVITISYWTYTKPFGILPNPIDIKFLTCQPQGAPKAPVCSPANLVATTPNNVEAGFAPGDSGFNDLLFPKHANRLEADGKSFTTFLVFDRCRSIVGSASTTAPVCSKIDLVLTDSTNDGATWSVAQPVEAAAGHQFFGTIRGDVSTGVTNIAYYSTQKDPFLQRVQIFLSQIPPGTTTVSPATALTSGSTDPDAGIQDFVDQNGVVNFGDRIGLAVSGTGTTGQSRVYVHYTWNNVFGISNNTKQPDPNNTLVPFTY
jgi:hypothetical protein